MSNSKTDSSDVTHGSEFRFVPLGPEKAPKGPARYQDPANPFNTWTGRGKRPAWLKAYVDSGHDVSEFLIEEET